MNSDKYGLLINDNIKLHRQYFSLMLKLLGINVIYRAPKPSKTWTTYAEIDTNYQDPIVTSCIFDQHPDQKSMKKLGWVAELQEGASIISVPFDLPDILVGALFIIPSALDNSEGRLFKVTAMSFSMIYPASITCQIVPEYETQFDRSLHDHTNNSFNLLNEEGDGIL